MDVSNILVDAVLNRSKVILALWVVAVLILVPPAFKMLESMGGGIDALVDQDKESGKAFEVISAYFDDPYADEAKIPLIVVEYSARDGYRQLMGDEEAGIPAYSDYLASRFLQSTDWLPKLDITRGGLIVMAEDMAPSSGAMVIGVLYKSSYSEDDMAKDTSALRDAISKFTDDYMYELYENEAHFSVYITGNPALTHDMDSEFSATALSAIVLGIVLTLILTGLFFGSGTSTMITTASVVPPLVVTMAVLFGLNLIIGVFVVSAILVLMTVMVMCFINCIYIISVYKRELVKLGDMDRAMGSTVEWTFAPIMSTSVCLFICAITLSIFGSGAFESMGISLSFATMISMVSSLTVPAALVRLTRNELFWTADADSRRLPRPIARLYSRIGVVFRRFIGGVSRVTSHHGLAVIVVSCCLAAGCAGYIIDQEGSNDELPNDMCYSLATGDSKSGMKVMNDYGLGGALYPYSVVLGYPSVLGTISGSDSLKELHWTGSTAVDEASALAKAILESDPENIAYVTYVVTWSDLLAQAGYTEGDDPEQALSDVRSILEVESIVLAQELDRTVLKLAASGYSYQDIVDSGGPYMDYALNMASGTIGYELMSDKTVAVTHLLVRAVTKESSVTGRSLDTSKAIQSVVDDFKGSSVADTALVSGVGVVYREMVDSVESGFVKAVPPVLLMFLVVMSISSSIGTAARGVVTTILSGLVSLCLTEVLMESIWGSVSLSVHVFMLTVCLLIGMWFNAVQENRIIHCRKEGMGWREASSTMLLSLQPVIVMAALVLSGCFAVFCVSGIQLLAQIGFAVALCILVDAFLVRTFVAPSIWSLKWRGKA